MQEEIRSEDEINLSDIFRALWTKLWVIVVALVIGAILGGTFGFVKYHDVHYYGANVTYFVSSEKSTSETPEPSAGGITQAYSEAILKQIKGLLESDKFSRTVMNTLSEAAEIEPDSPEEQKFFKLLHSTVSYNYSVGENKITVSVSALNDPDFAEHLLTGIKLTLPAFILEMMNNSVLGTTSCEQVTYELCRLLNEGQTTKEAIKFGLILGLAAAVIACAVIVIVDRTDNRLRDYENIPAKFDLPVLGVIPRFTTESEDTQEAKK